jgi:hypothetical protein
MSSNRMNYVVEQMVLGYWTFGTKLGSVLFYRRA